VVIYNHSNGEHPQIKEEKQMFEAKLLNELKEEFGITTAKYNKTIKLLIGQYIKGKISKQGLTSILNGFAAEK
jgi:hypothetical protein